MGVAHKMIFIVYVGILLFLVFGFIDMKAHAQVADAVAVQADAKVIGLTPLDITNTQEQKLKIEGTYQQIPKEECGDCVVNTFDGPKGKSYQIVTYLKDGSVISKGFGDDAETYTYTIPVPDSLIASTSSTGV